MQCRENNAAIGVTGMLLYANETFLQVIEGDVNPEIDRPVDADILW